VVVGAAGELDSDVDGELSEVVGDGLAVCVAVVLVSVTVDPVVVTIIVVPFPDCLLANSSRLCATTAFSW
jgi:hypothetical protein